MGYPKQPGQDAKAHQELAERHLAVLNELSALRAENARMRETLEKIAGHQNHHYAQAAGDCMEQMISDARAALGGRDE